tara:strand:- start:1688 stop:1864 length:177 start_codon:yes stop_codon:yes gene_type:complete
MKLQQYTDFELTTLSTDQIKKLFLEVRSILLQEVRQCNKRKDIEIYFCYITRELENRI